MEGTKAGNEVEGGLVDVDGFLKYVGEFKKKQIILQVMFCFLIMPGTFQTLLLTFVGNDPPWRCTGLNVECNQTGLVFDLTNKDLYEKRCKLDNRSSWEFVKPKRYSIVTEWDLVCDKKELSYLANSAMFLGWAFGALALGFVSDRYGRKPVLFPSVAVIIISGFVSGFVQNFWLFFLLRCVIGFAQGGVALTIFVLASELVGPRYRALSGTLIWFAFTLALCLVGFQAWLVPDWRKLELIMSAPYAFVVIFWKFVPESVRWLRINDRLEEAEVILREAAKTNGMPPPPVKLSAVTKESSRGTFADLFRPWWICKVTLILCFIWFVNGMVYYGVSLASDDLGGDLYRDFVLTSLVEIPANILVIVLGNKFGRKPSTTWSMFVGALSCGSVACIPSGKDVAAYNWLRVVFGMLGKLCITLSFNELYVWSVEIFPTVVRSQGMGLLQVISRVGAATAPWVAQWLRHFHPAVPFAVMGGLTMIATVLCFMLKETKGMATAEVLESTKKVEAELKMIAIENKYVVDDPPAQTPKNVTKDDSKLVTT